MIGLSQGVSGGVSAKGYTTPGWHGMVGLSQGVSGGVSAMISNIRRGKSAVAQGVKSS